MRCEAELIQALYAAAKAVVTRNNTATRKVLKSVIEEIDKAEQEAVEAWKPAIVKEDNPAERLFPPRQCKHWFPGPYGCGDNCAIKAYVPKEGDCPCASWEKK